MGDPNTLSSLQTEVAKILGRESVPTDIGIGELGLDSLKIVELILVCDQIYHKDIDPELLMIDQFTSLAELDKQIREFGNPLETVEQAESESVG